MIQNGNPSESDSDRSMTAHRIAYVLEYFPNLFQTFVASEIAELRRRGTEMLILSLQDPPDQLRHDFVVNHKLDELTVYGPKGFWGQLKKFRPQLIHAHFTINPTVVARGLAAAIGVPFTFTTHAEGPPADFAELAASAAAVVTVSEANARYLVRRYGVPREHLCVIPCGVDTACFTPVDRGARSSALAAPEEPGTILCVARHHPKKNLSLLLEACATLGARGVKFRCVMIGDGPAHEELIGIRARLKLEPLVEMVGAARQATVIEWLRRASVVVLCSHSEGMPLSLMEAGACELPVVATRVGGIPELVEDGVTGLLTPPGDAAALADALQRLLADPALRATMGQAARRRIAANFSLAAQVDSLQALWSRVLAAQCRERTTA